MEYQELVAGIKRFGAAEKDICKQGLGVSAEQIQPNVIITPGWEPEKVSGIGKAEILNASGPLYGIKIWNIESGGLPITYIKTGCGAPVLMDALLSLGVTKCRKILFISSVGALDHEMGIGDIVIPEYSVCGDGASRYIASSGLDRDVFAEKAYPDHSLYERLKAETERVCRENQVRWHIGRAFCTDTIMAQFAHIDFIRDTGCNCIDMETAAAFRAARLMKIPLAAVFNVSDNTLAHKSLITGRTGEEEAYRQFVRSVLMPQIILNFFHTDLS